MQTQGGSAAEDAINAPSREFRVRVLADWNNDGLYTHPLSDLSGFVESASTDRALKGSAPAEIMFIEGSAAAQLNLELGGKFGGASLVTVFSPYNGLSPLYTKTQVGTEIKYVLQLVTALGVVEYPQFIGNISTITPDRGDGSVQIVALDRVEKLRKPIVMANWGIGEYWAQRGLVAAQLQDPLNVFQICLQQCDVSATKYRPTSAAEYFAINPTEGDFKAFWVSGTGGVVPTIGYVDNSGPGANGLIGKPVNVEGGSIMYQDNARPHPLSPEPTKRPPSLGAMGTTSDTDQLAYWLTDRFAARLDGTWYGCMTINTDPAFTNGTWHVTAPDTSIFQVRVGEKRTVDIMVGSNQIWLKFTNENNGFVNSTAKRTIPAGNAADVFWELDGSTTSGTRAYFNVNGASAGWEYISNGYAPPSTYDQLTSVCLIHHRVSLSDVGCGFIARSGRPAGEENLLRRPAKYAAVLDKGVNVLTYTPDNINGKDAWDVITDVAAAEFGAVFWDETGVFHFWNNSTIKTKQNTSVRRIGLDQLEGLQITNSLDSVRNVYSVTTNKKRGSSGIAYKSKSADEFYVPPNSIKFFDIYEHDFQYIEPRFLSRYTKFTSAQNATVYGAFPQWSEYVTHGYVLQELYPDGWRESINAGFVPDVSAWMDDRGVLVLRVFHNSDKPIRFAYSSDSTAPNADATPALWLAGTVLTKSSDISLQTRDAASANIYGVRNFEASGEWYQERYNDKGLMNVLLPRTSKPIPTTQDVVMAGDPRLQLGDVLTLTDPDGLGEEMRVQVYGIKRTFKRSGGLTDNLSVELLRPSGQGIWNSSQYGRWDQSLIWN